MNSHPFKFGSYTTPDPETGVPTLDRRAKRVVAFVLFTTFAIGCFVGVSTSEDKKPENKSIPVCETENGSTQNVCKFKSGSTEVIFLDNGSYMYDVTNSTLYPQE